MRFLCISDIHGDIEALDAVLADAKHRGWDQLLVCGDLCFPGPEPLAVWKRLVEQHAVCVQGVSDRALAQIDPEKLSATSEPERRRIQRLRDVRRELGDLIIARLGKLPTEARLPIETGEELLLVHGCPRDPTEALTEDMTDDEIVERLRPSAAEWIVCGASHVPFQRTLDHVHVVNVGSVGEAPNGEYADAAIVRTSQLGVQIEPFTVLLPSRAG